MSRFVYARGVHRRRPRRTRRRGGPRAPGSGRCSRTLRGVVRFQLSCAVFRGTRAWRLRRGARARQSVGVSPRAFQFHTMKRRCYLSDLTSTTCHALIRAPPTNQADKIKAMPELPNERGRGRITKAVSTILSNEAHSVLPVEILGRDNRVLGLEFRHPALKFRLSSTAERARQS